MPLPKPNKTENENEWMDRCMSNETMKEEFSDIDQRVAVCKDIWRKEENNIREKKVTERRYYKIKDLPPLEVRYDKEKDQNILIGYAAKFNTWSQDLGGFREQVKPGAFRKTLLEGDIRALFNHDANLILGRTKNETLRLWEDETGLGFNIFLPDTTYAKDLKESIRRGDVSQNSFGFLTIHDNWYEDDSGNLMRDLQEVKLFDVSVVTFPAYEDTNVKLRKAFQNHGINYTFLCNILARSHKQKISDYEKKKIEETIEKLRSYISEPEKINSDDNNFESQKLALLLELERRKINYRRNN